VEMAVAGQEEAAKVAAEAAEAAARAAAGDSGSASASARLWLRLADGGGGAGALIAAYERKPEAVIRPPRRRTRYAAPRPCVPACISASEAIRGQSEGNRLQSVAISGNQRQSVVKGSRELSSGTQRALRSNQRQTEVNQWSISGNQWQSVAINGYSKALRGTQRPSEALRRTQTHSDALRRTYEALRRTHRHSDALRRTQTQSPALSSTPWYSAAPLCSEGTWTRDVPMTQIASAIIGGETAARAPVCCVVRTSLSFSPLTTLAPPPALVLRVPAPQDGRTPADLAKSNHNRAEVKAFFASGRVRPIRGHS